jgi:acyl-CoA thioesterase-2
MKAALADLLHLLELERIEDNIFRGESRDLGSDRVFGGQVLGQALAAANYTAGAREVHSLHAYFLLPGDVTVPVVYEVDIARDGKTFSTRRVVAIQHGRPILNMAASFQTPEPGLEHAAAMPQVPGPEGLADVREVAPEVLARLPEKMRRFLTRERPFELRPVEPIHLISPPRTEPRRHTWIKTVDSLPDVAELHRNLLVYMSDYQLVATATLPHGVHFAEGTVQLATLDHAMWFHRPFRVDDWLLYAMESPSASGGRGFALGRIFTRDGRLVASTVQEGVLRVWREESRPAGATIPGIRTRTG